MTRTTMSLASALLAVAALAPAAAAQWITTNGPVGSATRAFTLSAGGTGLIAGTAGSGTFLADVDYEGWSASSVGLGNLQVLSLTTGVNESGGEVLLAGTTSNGVFASWNHGQSWSAVNNGLTPSTVSAVIAIRDAYFGFGMVLFAGTHGGVFRSNGGQNVLWTPRNGGLTNPLVRALASVPGGDENDGIGARDLFAGTAGGVFLSTDGVTWLDKNSGLADLDVSALAATEPAPFEWRLFAGTPSGVFRSADLHGGWTSASDGLAGGAVQALLGVGSRIFAGTATGGVFMSVDDGDHWSSVNSGLSNLAITALASDGTFLFAATASGVFRRPLAELDGTTAVESGNVDDVALGIPHPNPFGSSMSVSFRLPATSLVNIAVHDVQGRRVAELARGVLSAGEHRATWNGRETTGARARAGVYFIRHERAGRVVSRPVVLMP